MRLIDVEQFCKDNPNFDSAVYVALSKAPTIEAEPVRYGEWIETFTYGCWHYDCPFCDGGYATKERQKVKENYCSNCGAKLDGGTGNENA